jgi:hypothetical protein
VSSRIAAAALIKRRGDGGGLSSVQATFPRGTGVFPTAIYHGQREKPSALRRIQRVSCRRFDIGLGDAPSVRQSPLLSAQRFAEGTTDDAASKYREH